ncbi:putative zinc finger binding to DNA consensus sequence [AT]GATA[AG] [Lyophyllum shimeji]|uniref:Zinc finger binding to DNA consensus sequence [AT]GATA[AG] n=1 Tax=Lyophyllum shimeji TaxID=47721 RepID=A0A9P3UU67_LYOSH|nr:putative zinc finger binding to DNA consensus sequence [AT]GATA[AG] [Lyophyllum shimeji]
MPSILNLKFKGNKSFVAFSNLNDADALTKTWKVCTKVASYLEQGQRLENLSWRLWHLQNLMVDTDNAKSKREFKKLSKCMGDKLDKEKGRSIEELEAPDFKANHSADIIRQRAEEKERSRVASQNATPGTIKRMQFTFSVDQPSPAVNQPVKKPNLKPSAEFQKRSSHAARAKDDNSRDNMVVADDEGNDKDPPPSSQGARKAKPTTPTFLRFPSLFSSDFGPSALLYPTPTVTTPMNYGEGLNPTASHDHFSISRPTIEVPLDELLRNIESNSEAYEAWNPSYPDPLATATTANTELQAQQQQHHQQQQQQQQDVDMHPIPAVAAPVPALAPRKASPIAQESEDESSADSDDEDSDFDVNAATTSHHAPKPAKAKAKKAKGSNTRGGNNKRLPPVSQTVKEVLPETVAPSKVNLLYDTTRASTPVGRPTLTVRTQGTSGTRSSGPGATATSLNSAVLRSTSGLNNGNSAPGGVKAECSNCGATHTPLWRRGLNDELNCNACGLYCKLHKRPRPKSMRNTHGERTQAPPRQETVDVMAQCYNCHTTATPLWRKDDEGKTVCNACGLYYKLHGSARPISMKSDVIRKRSRHDARRGGNNLSDTPSASPGVSRRASPAREASPTLAPDSTTQMNYDYTEELDFRSTQSELLGALGQDLSQQQMFHSFNFQFPGPYHPDYLTQTYTMPSSSDPLPFPPSDSSDHELGMSPRTSKRRRMSTDSASEPPSSATSYSSYNDGYSTPASSVASHSQRSSMEFPFSSYMGSSSSAFTGPALRGSGNTFWHPPMMPQGDLTNSPHVNIHPPMLPPTTDDSPMDYLHQPMQQHEEEALFSTFLHPPMAIPDDGTGQMGHVHPPMLIDYQWA